MMNQWCTTGLGGGVLLQQFQRNDLKSPLVRRCEDDGGGDVLLEQFQPPRGTDAPTIAGFETRKIVFGARSGEIVADRNALLEEAVGDLDTNRVTSQILLAGVAVTVPKKSGDRRM